LITRTTRAPGITRIGTSCGNVPRERPSITTTAPATLADTDTLARRARSFVMIACSWSCELAES
jgi:hypothetical protein